MNEITILHLSDIHFKRRKGDNNRAFRQAVQQRLMEAVTTHLKQHGNPDFVVITGDIAFSGKKEEYDEALTFLLGLKNVLSKETEFLVVPGNHDVDRVQIDEFFSLQKNIVREDLTDKFLEDEKKVKAYINVKFKAFREFVDRLNPGLYQNKEDYAWVKNCFGKNVSFLGLNSAWASEGDGDPLHIALGFPQVMTALDNTKGIVNKILLLHHPLFNCFELKDFNKWSGEIFDKCRLILHGHVHFDNALALNTPSASCISIGANAVYTHDGFIGFQFINVCFEEDRTSARVWPYRLETRDQINFLPDTSRWKGQQGQVYFNIETRDASVEKYPPLQMPADAKIIVDGKVIKQIEKLIGETLQFLPLKNIMKSDINGYSLNNARQIQGLNLDSRKVDDISFLSSLVGLTHLSLEDNQITDVTPLGLLTNLTNLNLKKNQIKDLTPLRELKNLTVLNLHENELTDISPLQDMAKLTELYLSKNKIIKIAVLSAFKNLKRLGLGDCQIADPALTQLSTLTNLETLALYENQITDITPLKALTKLTKLWLNSNQITDPTPLSALKKLTELDLRNNQITNLKPLNPLAMLTTLILERNQITYITPLRELKNLTVLNLSKNKITDITPLQDMAKLEELYLSKNKIMKFTVLSSFKNLKRLGLGDCLIADSDLTQLSTLTNLETLALYENQITDITPLRELKNLKVLDVRRNRIEKLPPEIITWWPSLEIKWVDSFIPGLILLDNPLTDPPVEIVKQGIAAVKKYFYFLDDRQISIQQVNELFEAWQAEIHTKNAMGYYDINLFSEDIALKLLNEVYNLNLVKINNKGNIDLGIDLGDRHNKIAFQITTRFDAQKIKDTLKKFTKGPKDIYSNGIRFLILSEIKPRSKSKLYKLFHDVYSEFNPNEHILTLYDLMLEIKKIYENDKQRFNRIKSILEKEIGGMDTKKREKIFISYSHDSTKHSDRVLALANRLRKDGLDCVLDQYETSPAEGWPMWMERQLEQAQQIIIIGTETYWRRVTGKEEKGKGKGVKWESTLTYQYIYDNDSQNMRFIPVVFDAVDYQYIPTPLKGATYYCIKTEEDYLNLYRRLTRQPEIEKPELGQVIILPPKKTAADFTIPAPAHGLEVSLYKFHVTGHCLFGREKELQLLDEAWFEPQTRILILVAWGGVGKTALVNQWLNQMNTSNFRGAQKVFGWSFYSQGAEEGKQASADEFFQETLEWFGDANPGAGSAVDKGRRLARLARQQKTLLILDGLEPLQYLPGELADLEGKLKDNGLAAFLKELADSNAGNKVLCVITTREPVTDLLNRKGYGVEEIPLEHLSESAGVALLKSLGVTTGSATDFHSAVTEYSGHALTLTLLGLYIKNVLGGDIRRRYEIPQLMDVKIRGGHYTQQMMEEWVYKFNRFISRELGLKKHPILKNEDLRTIKCPACNGTSKEMCISCLGSGMMGDSSCSNCFGSGKTICSYCGGTSWVSTKEREEYLQKVHYNDEAIVLIRKKNYEEALFTIIDAENQNCADDNIHALKMKVIKSLSDDEEHSYKKPLKGAKTINYPGVGSIQGRDGDIDTIIETMEQSPIITVYGIPGIGKSSFIHDIRKHKPYNNYLYKWINIKSGMTMHDLFQHLALPLGCRNLLNKTDFDISKQTDFSFLELEAQYHLDSFIHLDNAQFLFKQDGFHQPIIKEFLIAITQFYPNIKIILESRIIPPDGIFPENMHKSVRISGIDKECMRLYFHEPFKDDNFGWELTGNELELISKNLSDIKEKGKIHSLTMTLLASMAKQMGNTPAEILKNTDTLQKFIDESRELLLDDLNQLALQAENWNISQNLEMYHEDIPIYLFEKLQKCINELFPGSIVEPPKVSDTITDNLEKKFLKVVSGESYLEGKKLLLEIKDRDSYRFECLKEEFGYIYDFDNLGADETNRKPKQGQLEWRRKVWQFLSMRNNFEIPDSDPGEVEKEKTKIPEAQVGINDGIKDRKISADNDKKTSEAIGEDLEKAVLKLFKDFFAIMEEDNSLILTNARQQGRGLQFGHDLKFVCGRLGNKEIRLLIECKNYSDKITTKDIADN